MRHWRRWILGLAIWLAGVASALLYLSITGGWYEYKAVSFRDYLIDAVTHDGKDWGAWEVVHPGSQDALYHLRRPRLRLGS